MTPQKLTRYQNAVAAYLATEINGSLPLPVDDVAMLARIYGVHANFYTTIPSMGSAITSNRWICKVKNNMVTFISNE